MQSTDVRDDQKFASSTLVNESALEDPTSNNDPVSTISETQDKEQDASQTAPSPSKSSKADDPGLLTPAGSLRLPKRAGRPQLISKPTTAVTLRDVEIAGEVDRTPNTTSTAQSRVHSRRPSFVNSPRFPFRPWKDADDNASVRSLVSQAPTISAAGELEDLIGEALGASEEAALDAFAAEEEVSGYAQQQEQNFESQFDREFVELDDLRAKGNSEEALMLAWSLKLKHFLILTSAGKPIWSRHGDDQLISNTIGVIQTIISFYQEDDDVLKTFTAGQARFTVLSKGHLHLVAISRMGENDTQLRAQLDALYMQILSTLTLPSLEKQFQSRPSTDLRRPLQGTENLLSALADGFTRGSPSTLLSSLECLHLRKAHRNAINNAFLHARCPELLYGLLVTGSGSLISVLRPKKHSLHPGDLQLVFNMLFEAKGVRAGGGESWVPLCLPAFNNKGYVYMYVSFLDMEAPDGIAKEPTQSQEPPSSPTSTAPSVPCTLSTSDSTPNTDATSLAIILISAQRDAFHALRQTRDTLVTSLTRPPMSTLLTNALPNPRPSIASILPSPSTPALQHFLYKSRMHVQHVLPSPSSLFDTPLTWRRLMSRYTSLHSAFHTSGHRGGHGKNGRWHWAIEREGLGVAWVTPEFEMYAVAGARTGRGAVVRGVLEVVRWAKREEERVFVVGGAVF